MKDFQISGGIYGALDPDSKEASKHAEMYYERIRRDQYDVDKISENTGYEYEKILHIKNYLFINKHKLENYSEPRRFTPDFVIAESWRRLAYDPKNIKEHDRCLIEHELLEMSYYLSGLYNQTEAHNKANETANYQQMSMEYYSSIKLRKKSCDRQSYKKYHHYY